MKRWLSLLSFLILAVLLTELTDSASAAPEQRPGDKVPVLIRFASPPGPAEEALVRSAQGEIKYTYRIVPSIAASVPEAAIPGLLHNPRVTRIERDGVVHLLDAELDNAWGVKHIGAGIVHDLGNKGAGVKVGVLDTGIDLDHPDLAYDPGCSYDFRNNDPIPEDGHSHGTHVAGTIAALDNESGVVGVAPEVTLCIYKVFDDAGNADWSDIIAAVERAAMDDGVQVTNNSYGDSWAPTDLMDALDLAYNFYGVIHFAGAGNNSFWIFTGPCIYPALWTNVIAVGATTTSNGRASFSSVCSEMELAAPGQSINSTWNDGGYGINSGTSMASPHAAGTAALIIAAGIADSNGNGRINDEVRQRLIETADDLGSAGHDSSFGYGLVDADEAAQPSAPPPAPPTDLVATAGDGLVDLDWADNGEPDLASYNVKRSTSSGGPYSTIASGVLISTYADNSVTNGVTYYYVVSAVNEAAAESGNSNEDSATPQDMTAPNAPVGLIATHGDGSVSLDWADNAEADLAGYNVKRSTSSGGPYSTIAGGLNSSDYVDGGLTNGITYYYVVTAVDTSTNESDDSGEASATPQDAPPASPTGLTATAGDSSVSLDWADNAEPDLAGYNVYRAGTAGGPYVQIASALAASTYDDSGLTNGETYYYVVTAVDAVANESGYSNEDSATPQDMTAPDAPTGLIATAGDGSVSLDWADNAEADLAGYTVYRAGTAGGPYAEVASALAASAYDDSGLNNGQTYYYVVTAVDAVANESGYSNEDSATPQDMTAPDAPVGLIAAHGDGSVSLDWADNAEADLAGYNVKRSTSSGGPYSAIAGGLTSSDYVDSGLTNGITYYYVVTAVDTSTNESDDSGEASATPQDAPPASPTGLTATAGDSSVSLDWADNAEPDLAGYNVYRAGTAGGPYVQIASALATSTYDDSGLTNGETYYYVVTAVDAVASESGYSNEDSATPLQVSSTLIYVSASADGTVDGVSFADEDILAYDTGSGSWSMYFDGSDVGLGNSNGQDVDAFHVLPDGSLLLSVASSTSIPDVGDIDDSDIVHFQGTFGLSTSGTFAMYFDGSSFGLTRNGEDIDAITLLDNGDLVISTTGSASVPNVSSIADEDLVGFTPTGQWYMLFDGSDIGLSSNDEDTWGVWIDESGPTDDIYLTTRGAFSADGLSGDVADIFVCGSSATGADTSCGNFSIFWDGSAYGYGSQTLDGFSIQP